MARRELICGPNFSGRSDALISLLRGGDLARECFYIGPYAEAALSGLSNVIADEIEIYRARSASLERGAFAPLDFAAMRKRKPQTLSGGEQVLLALHCYSLSAFKAIAIDTALEQLDRAHRDATLSYLDPRRESTGNVALIDNRLPPPQLGWHCTERRAARSASGCDLSGVVADLAPRKVPRIAVQGLDFSYRNGKSIFRGVDLVLEPGQAYRLAGPNGAGKTTFLKILVGVLAPDQGEIMLGGERYRPWRSGNRVIALATQNPDHQWCGATLREDMTRRSSAFARYGFPECLSDERLVKLAGLLGVQSFDQHLYELPLAARKRLSWLWPLAGALPWAVLDEPTIGQDAATRMQLAAAIARVTALGYGVIFVTHDDDFAVRVPHRVLEIGDMRIEERTNPA